MTVVDLYTVQIVRDDGPMASPYALDTSLFHAIAEAEENLTDLLPAGYRARIRRWDTPTQEDNDE